jgi:SMC interacting uncharacterized protein involved in chromosome segregation
MLTRIGLLLVGCLSFVGLAGCVSLDEFRAKEQEVQTLSSANADMQERNQWLRNEKTQLENRMGEMKKEKDGLGERIAKLNGEIDYLQNKVETLEQDTEGLRERVEKQKAKIADLNKENQRLAALTRTENLVRTLGERMAELQKQVEVLSGENEVLRERVAAAWPPEVKKSSRAEGERTFESAGRKRHAVAVSSEQKTEDSEPEKQ